MTALTLDHDMLPTAHDKPSFGERLSGVFKRAASSARAVKDLALNAMSSSATNPDARAARSQILNMATSAGVGAGIMAATKLSCAAAFACAAAPAGAVVAGTALAVGTASLGVAWLKDNHLKRGPHATRYDFFSRENLRRNWKKALMSSAFGGIGAGGIALLDSDLIAARAQGITSAIDAAKGKLGIQLPALQMPKFGAPSVPKLSDVSGAVDTPAPVAPKLAPVETRVPRPVADILADTKAPVVAAPAPAPVEAPVAPVAAPKPAPVSHLRDLASGKATGHFSKTDAGIYSRAQAWIEKMNPAKAAVVETPIAPTAAVVPAAPAVPAADVVAPKVVAAPTVADAAPVTPAIRTAPVAECVKTVGASDGQPQLDCTGVGAKLRDVTVQPGEYVAVDRGVGTKLFKAVNGDETPVKALDFIRDRVAPYVLRPDHP